MKVLDCTTVETTLQSLALLFKTDIKNVKHFIKKNEYRIDMYKGDLEYKPLKIEDILDYFNLSEVEISPDKIMMFHITSGPTSNSFRDNGILNLESAIKNKLFSSFFDKVGIEIDYKESSPPLIHYQGDTFPDTMLFMRFSSDACVNGFLINEDAEDNPNITHIRNCPEFIHDISRHLNIPELVEQWHKVTKSMKISVCVDIEDIRYYELTEFVLKAVEYTLFKSKDYWVPNNNHIVYLKENIDVPKENIVQISKIERVHT